MAKQYRLSGGRKASNAVLKWLNGLGLRTGRTYLLTTTGRKSGQPRTNPVNLIIQDGQRWIVSPYGQVAWVQNVRANGRVTLQSGRTSENVQLREMPPAQAAPILKKYLESYGATAPFFKARKGDPVDRFTAEADLHPVFSIDRA